MVVYGAGFVFEGQLETWFYGTSSGNESLKEKLVCYCVDFNI